MRNPTDHFYNEIYSYYYKTVAEFINCAIKGELTHKKELEILDENPCFSKDLVLRKIHFFNEWFIVDEDKTSKLGYINRYKTDIECEYKRPVSLLEKRWLKSIITDPRIKLFDIDFEEKLQEVEPLFNEGDFISIGAYNDGDDYHSENYRKTFKTVLKAINENWGLRIISENARGELSPNAYEFAPEHIEYSELEDKFSIYGYSPNEYGDSIVRIGRIKRCELCSRPKRLARKEDRWGTLTIQLDGGSARTNNALERMLIEFSHYNKRVKELNNGDYIIELEYLLNEEKELSILRLMPFAQYVRIISPESIQHEISERLKRQALMIKDILPSD